ncbi:MAG TPA: MFS transporter [Rhizomicrobium sp.]|nr:MFS transporter [Rhizomicrobium sp.]
MRSENRPALFAWALYDWAGAPFTTLALTFVLPVYFAQAVVGDATTGQELWSAAVAVSGIAIAIASPVMGVFADVGGRGKAWLLVATMVCIAATTAFWFVGPSPRNAGLAMLLIAIGNFAYVSGVVFNNAALPTLASRERMGRWSGWAWGFGYIGGLAALLLFLLLFALDVAPVRIAGPLAAVWFALFSWPRFVWTPDRPPLREAGLRAGLEALRSSFVELLRRRDVLRFLVANMLYADALVAIFTVGGIYAAGAIGMSLPEVTRFAVALNVAAGAGAFAFSWLDDRIGPRRTILLSLAGLLTSGAAAVLATGRLSFWIAGCALGFFVGPAQSASRSFVARIAPQGRETEYFGLFALSGKATAFIGPVVVAVSTWLSGSQRVGLASLLVLIAAGASMLWRVDEAEAMNAGRS